MECYVHGLETSNVANIFILPEKLTELKNEPPIYDQSIFNCNIFNSVEKGISF